MRNWLPTGRERSAATQAGPQAQPARSRVSAIASASSRLGCGASASSPSRIAQASRSASAWACAPFGSVMPSAWASPTADGAQKVAGRTKA